jgi:vacuolar protein 8
MNFVAYPFADDLKPQLLDMGICEVLIPLTASSSVEVQGNSAAALGNLSSKGSVSSHHVSTPAGA